MILWNRDVRDDLEKLVSIGQFSEGAISFPDDHLYSRHQISDSPQN